jgi:hypothetical protein
VPLHNTRRVSCHEPCPVCGRPDWCLVALDGRYAVCMRHPSDRPARGGGYIHWLRDSTSPDVDFSAASVPVPPSSPTLAGLDRRHRVCSALLNTTPLATRHEKDLARRGCSRAEISAWGYRTLYLRGRARLAKECHNGHPDDLAGVPGFYIAAGAYGPYWNLAGSPGLLIPVRAPDHRIRGFRIRPNEQGDGGKYRWLSSAKQPGGTGMVAHCHVSRPKLGTVIDPAVWVTEGEIKADLAAERLGAIVVSIPGVSSWALAIPDVKELLPNGGRVVVALDSDWREKPPVHNAIWCLSRVFPALGYRAEVAQWPARHKGLDDLLTAGLRPQLTAPADLPEPAWESKVSSVLLAESTAPPTATAISLTDMRDRLRATLGGLSRCT